MASLVERGALGLAIAVSVAEVGQNVNMPIPMALGLLAVSGIVGVVSTVELAVGLGDAREPSPLDVSNPEQ